MSTVPKVWKKLESGLGVSYNSTKGDARRDEPFLKGIKLDPKIHDLDDLIEQSKQWLWPNKPGQTGPVPGRLYDSSNGWLVKTQLCLLKRYVEEEGYPRNAELIKIRPAFNGKPNSKLEQEALVGVDNGSEAVKQPSAAWTDFMDTVSGEERKHLGRFFRDVLESRVQETGDDTGTLESIGMLDDCDSLHEKAEKEVAAFRAEADEDKKWKGIISRTNPKRKRETNGSLRLIETKGKRVKSRSHVRRGCEVETVELSMSQQWVRDQLEGETTKYSGFIKGSGLKFITDIVQAHKDADGNVVRIDLREVKPGTGHNHIKNAVAALFCISRALKRNPPQGIDVKLFLDLPRPIHPDMVEDFESIGVTVKVWPVMPTTLSSDASDAGGA